MMDGKKGDAMTVFNSIKYKNIIPLVAVMLVILLCMIVSSYGNVWKHVFIYPDDLTPELIAMSRPYYGSKYHIWYESFGYYALLLFLLLPVVTSRVYAAKYYNKTDVHTVYREGLTKYYIKRFFVMLVQVFAVVAIPLLIYWGGLNIFAGDQLFIEGTSNPIGHSIIPVIYIFNEVVRELAIHNPNSYIWLTMAVFIISGVNYGIYSYALGNLIKSGILRYFAPIMILVAVDFIIGQLILNAADFSFFGVFSPGFTMGFTEILVVNGVLLVCSIVLLAKHYANRRANG